LARRDFRVGFGVCGNKLFVRYFRCRDFAAGGEVLNSKGGAGVAGGGRLGEPVTGLALMRFDPGGGKLRQSVALVPPKTF
jgi:hypothetical protein